MYVRPLLVAVVGISKAIMIVMMIAIIMLMNMVAMVVGASVNMAWLIAGMGVHEKAGEGTDRG